MEFTTGPYTRFPGVNNGLVLINPYGHAIP
jgi:hypothetical protein